MEPEKLNDEILTLAFNLESLMVNYGESIRPYEASRIVKAALDYMCLATSAWGVEDTLKVADSYGLCTSEFLEIAASLLNRFDKAAETHREISRFSSRLTDSTCRKICRGY